VLAVAYDLKVSFTTAGKPPDTVTTADVLAFMTAQRAGGRGRLQLAGQDAGGSGSGPRDLPYGEEPLAVRWHKRQYRCRERACPRKAFTESIAGVPPRARLTGRLCRRAAAEVAGGRSVSAVASEYQVSSPVIHRHYAAHTDRLLTEPEPTAVLGIDETRRGAPKWVHDAETGRWVRTERFETNFTDLAGQGRLLGQVAGRTGRTVTGWLADRCQAWKDQVAFVAMDPCAVYRSAEQRALPHAVIVVDHFRRSSAPRSAGSSSWSCRSRIFSL
jgi:transposase